jgi:hypothetical protein
VFTYKILANMTQVNDVALGLLLDTVPLIMDIGTYRTYLQHLKIIHFYHGYKPVGFQSTGLPCMLHEIVYCGHKREWNAYL